MCVCSGFYLESFEHHNLPLCLFLFEAWWSLEQAGERSAHLRAFDVKGKKITYFLEPKHLAQVVVEYILHF